MEIEYLSASRLQVYCDCPFRYFLQYHLKLPELREDTIHTLKGSATHEVLEAYVNGELDYVAKLKEFYKNSRLWELDNRKPDRGFPHPQPKECEVCPWAVNSAGSTICTIAGKLINAFDGCPRNNFEDDLGLVKKAIFRDESPLNRKVLGAEVPFDEKMEGFRVHGYIDLITEIDSETMEVSDYKTGNYTKNSEAAFKDLQMRIYSMIAKKKFPQYNYVMMTLDYLRKTPVTVIFSEEDDQKTIDFLADAYKKIVEDENPARIKSFKCNWCVGYDECGKIRESFIKNGKFRLPTV